MPVSREPEVTLFAVIRIDRNRPVSDLDRFIALALPSFRTRLPADLVREIVVVVPPSDVREVTDRLTDAAHIPIRVIDEHEVAEGLDEAEGWIKQQILKLAAPAVVETPWFITLDADVVATRPVDRDFLLPDGRAIWEQEPVEAHLSWWEASARLLGTPWPIDPATPAFGVTPAIMHTDSLRGLARAIEAAHPGRSWLQTLVALRAMGWTEYSLYWTHVIASGRANELYADVPRVPYALAESIWTPDDLDTLDLASVFDPAAEHAFFVFQSNLELPLEKTVALLRPYIQTDATVAPDELRQWERHARAYRLLSTRRSLSARLRRMLPRA